MDKESVIDLAKIIDYQKESIVSKEIIKGEQGGVTLFAFDRGQGLSEHTVAFDAMITVVEGQAEVIIDGESFFVAADKTIILPANHPHAVEAKQPFKMVLVMVKK
jgi:quercetin dioxygenase-like cupin family protein